MTGGRFADDQSIVHATRIGQFVILSNGCGGDHRGFDQKTFRGFATNQPSAGDSRHKMSVTAIGGFGSPGRLR
jgi:hypothetical protein